MKSFISRKDRIILSAIDIINEFGIQGLSIKEIAARQEVNESALYRHFKNKDSIIDGVLEYFAQFDEAIYNSVMKKDLGAKEKVIEYNKAFLEYYESYPAITAILLIYESLNHDSNAKKIMSQILEKRINNLSVLIKECQKKGEINTLFSPKELVFIIFGFCNKMILQWRIDGFNYSLKDNTLITMDKLLTKIFN